MQNLNDFGLSPAIDTYNCNKQVSVIYSSSSFQFLKTVADSAKLVCKGPSTYKSKAKKSAYFKNSAFISV